MEVAIGIFDAHVTVGPGAYVDTSPEELLALMDEHGVRRALLSPVDRWLAVDNREGNDMIAQWVQTWPERFLGYATANPWYGKRAVAELQRALDAGLSAVKLHPFRQGFVLLDTVARPLLEIAARRGTLVYVVTGVAVASMPLQLAELAQRYPSVPFIMGRSGRGDFGLTDVLPAVRKASNIFIETVYNMPDTLNELMAVIGPRRVVFSSDAPLTNLALELGKLDLMGVDQEIRAAILGGNLARILSLPNEGANNEGN